MIETPHTIKLTSPWIGIATVVYYRPLYTIPLQGVDRGSHAVCRRVFQAAEKTPAHGVPHK